MKTEIFESYSEFKRRVNKRVNGVSPTFAKEYPDYEKDNKTNEGCWDCRQCKNCTGCWICNGCEDCRRCEVCIRCKGHEGAVAWIGRHHQQEDVVEPKVNTGTTGDLSEALNQIVKKCHDHSRNRGWWSGVHPDHVVPVKLCLIHSEISEAMEGHRKNLMDDKLPERKMIEVELADAIIRIADLAGALRLDLGGAMVEKLEFNDTRKDHDVEVRKGKNGKSY